MSNRTLFSACVIFVLIAAVGLAGCGKKEEFKPAPTTTAQTPPPPPAPTVASMTFARGVDVNWTALNPTTEFRPSDRVNVSIRTENAVPGNQLLVKWMFLGTQQLVKADSVVLKESGVNNSAFFIERARGFPAGEYRLDVFLNGTLVKTGDFKVVM